MRVLIATDGTDISQEALSTAVEYLDLRRHEVHVVAIASLPTMYVPTYPLAEPGVVPIMTEQDSDAIETSIHRALDAARRYLEPLGIEATYVYGIGEPATELLQTAKGLQPDLIVVGSHGRGPLGRLFRGSVSEALLHRWHGPVLVAREPDEATTVDITQESKTRTRRLI